MEAPTVGPKAAPKVANVVHESESQRQHVRVRLPGVIEFDMQGQRCCFKLHDLSAGGLCFESGNRSFRVGSASHGNLILTVDKIAISLSVTFQIRNVDAHSGRTGCCFQDLGAREISALRHLITSFLSGDIVSVGDVLHTLGRENFTKPRAVRDSGGNLTGRKRARASLLTLLVFAGGVVAFGYTLQQLYDLLFVTNATVAKVAGPVYSIVMPREGTFYSLVPSTGMVKKGAAIASFEAPVLDLVRNQIANANLTPDMLNRMLTQTVKGTITSPCDCRVQTQFVADAQYVGRGQPLFELAPRDFKNPHIMARFRFDQMEQLPEGSLVHFRINGDGQQRVGRVSQVRVSGQGEALDSQVLVMVEPLQPLPPALVNRPAEVQAGGLVWITGRLGAMTSAVAKEDP